MAKIRQFSIQIKEHPFETLLLIMSIALFRWVLSLNSILEWIVISFPAGYWLFIIFEFWRSQKDQNSSNSSSK
ncbi:hypothetical protein HMPREF9104_01375 [Lentilactobacillus kisonensis F0435]|uniref:Uncharacterized protein n=1 Tax=Lentilactobacillus kisonensis F0435 TaxID=797516 RepID=H1LFJ9_9LACO|nr:hypothetical protein HMPREF9104_01375 [Lentilactobacillus kisonensis F0435]